MITLGELKKVLESVKDKDGWIEFDFGGAIPLDFTSYRGDYAEVALEYSGEYGTKNCSPKDLYDRVAECFEYSFTGWKGGEYMMTENTPIHVACEGRTSETYIKEVHIKEYSNSVGVTLVTYNLDRY